MFRYFFIAALAMAGGYLWGYADGLSVYAGLLSSFAN
jgi:hypothetical protein